jgi:hypothetical protein
MESRWVHLDSMPYGERRVISILFYRQDILLLPGILLSPGMDESV